MRGRPLLWLLAAAVLGASCSGDRPAPTPTEAPRSRTCAALPGRAPEGFVLVRSREVGGSGYIGTHRTYRAPDGSRLDILLGAVGQIGEGMPLADELFLPSGARARLLGEGRRWALVWEDPPPCVRNGIIAEGVRRSAFLDVLRRMGLMP